MKSEELLHWADEKEVVSTNKPIKLALNLISHLPAWSVFILVFPVSFFYLIASKRARHECRIYQKQLREFSNGSVPKRISPYAQIVSFSLCILEKMMGWLGRIDYSKLIKHDDDLQDLINLLDSGKGAVLIGSHLGNIELLRSLSCFNETGVSRNVPVTTIMELKATEQFNNTLKEINPGVEFNVIDPSDIGPDTICTLQESIQNGGLVVVAADRTSARARTRVIREKFLGKEADFPYGVFLMTALLKSPTYFVYGLRSRTYTLNPKNHMYVEKAKTTFDCPRSERENNIKNLCKEYIRSLEQKCMEFPYQWYNFFNFWLLQDGEA